MLGVESLFTYDFQIYRKVKGQHEIGTENEVHAVTPETRGTQEIDLVVGNDVESLEVVTRIVKVATRKSPTKRIKKRMIATVIENKFFDLLIGSNVQFVCVAKKNLHSAKYKEKAIITLLLS